MSGRYAPSPTGDLHLGNLRTAMVAWLLARSFGRKFHLRIEDLDQARVQAAGDCAKRQIFDLERLGLDFDGPVMYQSNRLSVYAQAAAELSDQVYECFCTRKEIAEAALAPHGDCFRPYLGTCRNLTERQRAEKKKTRSPALRIRAEGATQSITDIWAGKVTGIVDDFVIRRNDGTWAYNFVVCVDDISQGVDQVVRGDDLLSSAPRQAWLTEILGGQAPVYAHVPLVLNSAGKRLQKRDGAVTLRDLEGLGYTAEGIRSMLAHSLGLAANDEPVEMADLLKNFDANKMPLAPWKYHSANGI